MPADNNTKTVLVHLGAGIGNIVFATPLLVALRDLGLTTDLMLDADYPDVTELFTNWSAVRRVFNRTAAYVPELSNYDHIIPALPPFYWPRFAAMYRGHIKLIPRPCEGAFYENEQEFYLTFARKLGFSADSPCYTLPIAPSSHHGITARTVVLAPGCKTGEMAAKRWPYFSQLAERFRDVVVVGTIEDLYDSDKQLLLFPGHARSFIGSLTLRETAELLASAGVVVGNDSGLSHLAAATGTSTVMVFGPTPHQTLGRFPPNVTVVRAGLPCEPCWFGSRFEACASRISCLQQVSVQQIEAVAHGMLL